MNKRIIKVFKWFLAVSLLIAFAIMAFTTFFPFPVQGEVFEVIDGKAVPVPVARVEVIQHKADQHPGSLPYLSLRLKEEQIKNKTGLTPDTSLCADVGGQLMAKYEDLRNAPDGLIYRDAPKDPLSDWKKIIIDPEYTKLSSEDQAGVRRTFWLRRLGLYSMFLPDNERKEILATFFKEEGGFENIRQKLLDEGILMSKRKLVTVQSDKDGRFSFRLPRGEYMVVAVGNVSRRYTLQNVTWSDDISSLWVSPLKIGYFNDPLILGEPLCSPYHSSVR